jgi:hypothetical protein
MHVIANIDIEDSINAEIKISYRINKGDLKTIQIKGLAFRGSKIYEVEAVLSNSTKIVAISEKNFLLTGSLLLPDDLATDSIVTLSLKYDVLVDSNKSNPEFVIPVLFVDLKPIEAPEDFFQATISVPPGQIISEAFPTIPLEFSSEAEANRYVFSMQVLPAMIKLRLVDFGNNDITLLGIIDLSVATLILILLGIGWIKLKQSLK